MFIEITTFTLLFLATIVDRLLINRIPVHASRARIRTILSVYWGIATLVFGVGLWNAINKARIVREQSLGIKVLEILDEGRSYHNEGVKWSATPWMELSFPPLEFAVSGFARLDGEHERELESRRYLARGHYFVACTCSDESIEVTLHQGLAVKATPADSCAAYKAPTVTKTDTLWCCRIDRPQEWSEARSLYEDIVVHVESMDASRTAITVGLEANAFFLCDFLSTQNPKSLELAMATALDAKRAADKLELHYLKDVAGFRLSVASQLANY